MDCARVRAEGIAESYLLGRLAETERDDFEEHFLACNACFEELKSLQALQAELARTRAAVLREGDPRRQARWPWLLAAAAALVACVAGVVTWQRLHAPIDSSTTLAELARVEAPPWAPVRLRGSEGEAARRFSQAMELYTKGDWAGALPGLRAAAALDPEAPQVAFYLGATALLAGRTDEAIVALRATVALGDTPVLEEARFYLARAAFRQGDIAAARTELAALVALGGERRAAAERLLDSLGESTKAAP